MRWRLLWVALWALSGCEQDDLTAQERALLEGFLLGPVPASPTNAVADDPRAAALGQKLYFDARFSGPLFIGDDGHNGGLGAAGASGRVACVSCHDLASDGVDTRSRPRATSLGARWGSRQSTPVYNLPYLTWIYWDGRKDSVWSSSFSSLEGAGSHNTTRLAVAHLMFDLYRAPYEQVFGPLPDLSDKARFPPQGKPGDPAYEGLAPGDKVLVTRVLVNFGKAVEAYERLLLDRDAAFDRYMAGDRAALSAAAVRGARLFVGRAACNECHSGPLLSDNKFHNDGIAQQGETVPLVDRGRADGIKRLLADEFNAAGPYSDNPRSDHLQGLVETGADLGAFRTPPLRGVTRTAPYMHTGAIETLWDVLVWYRAAAGTDGYVGVRDPAISPLRLSDQDLSDLVEFLKALEGAPLPRELITRPALP